MLNIDKGKIEEIWNDIRYILSNKIDTLSDLNLDILVILSTYYNTEEKLELNDIISKYLFII